MDFGVFDHLDRGNQPLKAYYESRLKLIEAYERAGFYGYHIAEHHSTPLGMAPSPSVFLAAVAQRTTRIRLGTLVYALPLYHPLRLIEEIGMLDHLSGGRLDVGFGRGSSPAELVYYGTDPDSAQSIYEESLELITRGLTERRLSFKGAHYQFDDVPMEIEPLQQPHPPIWYGVHSPESAERAARRGLSTVSLDPVDMIVESAGRFREVWREAHGERPLPKMGLGRFIVLAETEGRAMDLARRAYLRWHDSFTYLFRLNNRTIRYPRPPSFDELMAVGQGVAGTPETVTAWLRDQLDTTGLNYLVGQFAFGDMTPEEMHGSLDLFTARVAPHLH
jgi:alkanesulfonate monooxygenase SsuD/methylene tetrahydromethanopterin reductase-like flavin-dependent oxidoreductase (luciferase family)